jgi:hypothetical protein
MSATLVGASVLVVLGLVSGLVLGVPIGFAFRDALERRICGWLPGSDEE